MLNSIQREILIKIYNKDEFDYTKFEVELKFLSELGYVTLKYYDNKISICLLSKLGKELVENNL